MTTPDPLGFLADIEQRPASLERLAVALDAADPWAAISPVRRVLLYGAGSSRYAAGVAARRLRAGGVDAVAERAGASPSGALAGPETLAIGVSASGRSAETISALAAHAGRSRVVALTNDPDSGLTAGADHVVALHAGPEAGGVACRTYTHTLALLLALEGRITGRPVGVAARCRAAAAAVADLLERRARWLPAVLDALDGPHGVYLLAPAERLASAEQGALMVREGPRRPATGCETADWSHVDVYLTKTLDYRALLFPGSPGDGAALRWLRERRSTVVAVGADGPDDVAAAVRYPGDDDPLVALLAEVVVPELVAATWWASPSSAGAVGHREAE